MTPPGLCLLFNNAYSSLSLHAVGPALSKHIHKNELNTHNSTHFITRMRDYFFTSYLPPTVYASVCVCVCVGETWQVKSPTVCAHESISSHCSDLGLCRFAYNSTKQAYHRDLWSMCKHLLCDLKAPCTTICLAEEMKGGEKWRERTSEGKIRDLWPSTAVRMKAILSSACLLSSSPSCYVCVCVLPSFSIGFHFSCTGISLPNGK